MVSWLGLFRPDQAAVVRHEFEWEVEFAMASVSRDSGAYLALIPP